MKIWNLPFVEYAFFHEIEPAEAMILVTTPGAWEAASEKLAHLSFNRRLDISEATVRHWTNLTAGLLPALPALSNPVIYAVGTGLAVDAAKFIAMHTGLQLVSLPTALSVDSFFTWSSGARHEGCVEYIETKPPDHVILDLEVIAAAPPGIRAAGLCDVVSIATGLWDWEYAEEHGRNPEGMELIPWAAETADAILQAGLDCAEAAGQGDEAGLKQLADCLALEVQLCNQLGHSRPVEGTEHYIAYLLENELPGGTTHGSLIGPGILTAARLQSQDPEEMQMALEAVGVRLNDIPAGLMEKSLRDLPAYVEKYELPFGIAHNPEYWEKL